MGLLGQIPGDEHNAEVANQVLGALREAGLFDAKRKPKEELVRFVVEALNAVKSGKGLTLSELEDTLTTQEAANLLNVSRPYIVKLLKLGAIPFRKVGTHRRILRSEFEKFRQEQEAKSKAAFEELLQESEDLGLYE